MNEQVDMCADCDHSRAGWASGEWDNEPDRLEFQHAGFDCLLHRGGLTGGWCGYVGLPSGHRLHGADYDEVDVEVHGGLTYAGKCNAPICHASDGGDHLYWLGFDCGHRWDFLPGHEATLSRALASLGKEHESDPDSRYRTMTYARAETEHLAEQLAVIA